MAEPARLNCVERVYEQQLSNLPSCSVLAQSKQIQLSPFKFSEVDLFPLLTTVY